MALDDTITSLGTAIINLVNSKTGGIVDQTFDPTSVHAQSGVALAKELDDKQNKLTSIGRGINTTRTTTPSVIFNTVIQNTALKDIIEEGGSNWTKLTCNGTLFLALHNQGYVSTSTDGISWTSPINPLPLPETGVTEIWVDCCYANSRFTAVTNRGRIATSTDGVNWTDYGQIISDFISGNTGNKSISAIIYHSAWSSYLVVGQQSSSKTYISQSSTGTSSWSSAVQIANSNYGKCLTASSTNPSYAVFIDSFGNVYYGSSATSTTSWNTNGSHYTRPIYRNSGVWTTINYCNKNSDYPYILFGYDGSIALSKYGGYGDTWDKFYRQDILLRNYSPEGWRDIDSSDGQNYIALHADGTVATGVYSSGVYIEIIHIQDNVGSEYKPVYITGSQFQQVTTAGLLKSSSISGTSGVLYWSNGFCIQWGQANATTSGTNVNLTKTYNGTSYSVIVSAYRSSKLSNTSVFGYSNSSSQIKIGAYAATDVYWITMGQLASGQY